MTAFALLAAVATPAGSTPATDAASESTECRWDFRVLLDGRPIGEHHFRIDAAGDRRTLSSAAAFKVSFLGITVYRYRHEAIEQWHGNCLSALWSTTDDNGQLSSVRSAEERDVYRISTPAGEPPAQGCIMSYAYWNPAIRAQTRLLNAQTGRLDTVHIEPAGSGTVEVAGRPLAAMRLRISGNARTVDVWYSAQDQWIGLDTTVDGGRTLSYRLP